MSDTDTEITSNSDHSQSVTISMTRELENSDLPPALMTRRIDVWGALNMDEICRVTHFPGPSETVTAQEHRTTPGGKGVVQAVAAMRLSRTRPMPDRNSQRDRYTSTIQPNINIVVNIFGVIGDDQAGKEILAMLMRECLSVEHIKQISNTPTGKAFINVDKTGENHVTVVGGANHRLRDNDIHAPVPYADLVILQLEMKRDVVAALIAEAKKHGASVLLNAAPAVQLHNDLYSQIDHLIINQVEADILLDASSQRRDNCGTGCRKSEIIPRYQRFCSTFLEKGVRNVVITLSRWGGVAATLGIDGQPVVIDYDAYGCDNVVDETGCGGCFIGAYAVEVLKQQANSEPFDMKRAVTWASKAAGLNARSLGSIDGIPWADQVDPA